MFFLFFLMKKMQKQNSSEVVYFPVLHIYSWNYVLTLAAWSKQQRQGF